MRKSINNLLCLTLVFGLSLNLSAQTDEELDQVELLNQFIGTWEGDIGKDSVIVILFTPLNNGLHFVQENKANGEPYMTFKGVVGFSDDKQMIYGVGTTTNGTLILDYGKFETKTKWITDRCYGNTSHVAQMMEWEFVTPESFVVRGKWRGNGMTWPTDWNEWGTLKKVK